MKILTPSKRKTLKELHAKYNIIDPVEVEERLMRAHKTLWAMPDLNYHLSQSSMPEYLDPLDPEYMAKLQARFERFKPSPFDVSDCLIALGWLIGMQPNEKKIIEMVAEDMEFKQIAEVIGRDVRTAKNRYRNAISNAWLYASIEKEKTANRKRIQREIKQGKRSCLSVPAWAQESAIC